MGRQEYCSNCSDPLSDQSQGIRQITINLHITPGSSTTKKPFVNMNVCTAISSVYKLDYLNDLSTTKRGQQHDIHEEEEDMVLCIFCANIFTILYKSFDEFNQIRKLNSQLSKRIQDLDKIFSTIRNAQNSVNQNNFSNNLDDCDWETEGMDLPLDVPLSVKEDKVSYPNNNNFDESKNVVTLDPQVKLSRLTQEEINQACGNSSTNEGVNIVSDDDDDDFEPDDDDVDFEEEEKIYNRPYKRRRRQSNNGNDDDSTPKRRRVRFTVPIDPPDDGPPASCPLCQMDCPTSANLVHHLLTSHRPKDESQLDPSKFAIVCPLCSKAFTAEETLRIHVRVHLKYKPYKCPRCFQSFASKCYVRNHIKNSERAIGHEGESMNGNGSHRNRCVTIPCVFCSLFFRGLDPLEQHYKTDHVGLYPLSCSVCQKGFYNKNLLQKHEDNHVDKSFLCPKCDYNRFATEADLEGHMKECLGPKSHKCSTCGRGYSTRDYLLRHVKVHKGETFHCDKCPASFNCLRSLKGHMRRHTLSSSFVCQFCSRVLSTGGNLKAHIAAVHSDVRTSICHLCGRGFVDARKLRGHMRTHDQQRPFVCPQDNCGKSYKTSDSLKYHEKSHTTVPEIFCSICDRGFIHKKSLAKHLKVHRRQEQRLVGATVINFDQIKQQEEEEL